MTTRVVQFDESSADRILRYVQRREAAAESRTGIPATTGRASRPKALGVVTAADGEVYEWRVAVPQISGGAVAYIETGPTLRAYEFARSTVVTVGTVALFILLGPDPAGDVAWGFSAPSAGGGDVPAMIPAQLELADGATGLHSPLRRSTYRFFVTLPGLGLIPGRYSQEAPKVYFTTEPQTVGMAFFNASGLLKLWIAEQHFSVPGVSSGFWFGCNNRFIDCEWYFAGGHP